MGKATKIGWDNVVAELLVECACDERFYLEYEWIRKLKALGHPLTNIVYSADEYTTTRQQQSYFDDFILRPDHFVAMFDVYLNGLERTGDRLHDKLCEMIEAWSKTLLEEDLNTYTEMFQEALAKSDDDQEVNKQAAAIYKRISAMLERD